MLLSELYKMVLWCHKATAEAKHIGYYGDKPSEQKTVRLSFNPQHYPRLESIHLFSHSLHSRQVLPFNKITVFLKTWLAVLQGILFHCAVLIRQFPSLPSFSKFLYTVCKEMINTFFPQVLQHVPLKIFVQYTAQGSKLWALLSKVTM